ncbi:NAD-dependent epimerase/dehydratase family protein [Lacibacterium aquatile]|uniref:NAD-dependent epimerase/dehydratase family protein n=1 Tax=Lacibacterium aquatile TaxID=1168082 RepID=A0ABW5DRJ1_9PROT
MSANKPVLLTGAAGNLGRWLRPRLIEKYGSLLSTDIVDGGPVNPGEEYVLADLADGTAIDRLVARSSKIIHLGAVSIEKSFMTILSANYMGTFHVFEAAKQHGVKRIVFASSNHVIGFHETTTELDAESVMRPDGFYGVSKAFGENLASLYHDKHGLEIACLRIGSALPEPLDIRHLSTWLSLPDLLQLIDDCLTAPNLGFEIVYGASNNDRGWWDNSKTKAVKFQPKDNSEIFAEKLMPGGKDPRDQSDPAVKFQGGPFCK